MMHGKAVTAAIREKARKIRLLLTDVDGVLTDTGVYYSEKGETLKRFSIRDGMGVERLRRIVNVETGIITGEKSASIRKRADKLQIAELHLGIKEKEQVLEEIMLRTSLSREHIAYIGDDINDLEIIKKVGLSACPSDSFPAVKKIADFICSSGGGQGAFRELAEFIIASKLNGKNSRNSQDKRRDSK
ncbi:MAG: HAD-IIIA family hydrolase [Dissulfurispiraceae bacterium]|jgi:YrbI family 3-deoxy-D-manno-octulosonate 8-phosphate phosphatase